MLYYLDGLFAEQLAISRQYMVNDWPWYMASCLITFMLICPYMQYYEVRIKYANGWFDMVIHTAYLSFTERSNFNKFAVSYLFVCYKK